jgi:hypothetical protein
MIPGEAEGSIRRGRILPSAAWRLDELICPDRAASTWARIKLTAVQHKFFDGAIAFDGDIDSKNTLGESLARSGVMV